MAKTKIARHYNTKENPISPMVQANIARGMDTLQAMRSAMLERAPWAASHSGFDGDVLEMAVSYYCTHRVKSGIRSGEIDMKSRRWGKVEIKSACGELPTGNFDTVLYCPEVDYNKPLVAQVVVFTRDEWEAFLSGYEGRGAFLRVDSERGKMHIQSFRSAGRPKASKPIREYIDAVCSGQPKLEDF